MRNEHARLATLLLVAASFAGCFSAASTTLARPAQPQGQVIYRISEEVAFTTALAAYAALLPNQSVDDIVDGHRRGYNAHERSFADSWAHRVFVVPAIGTNSTGREVHGYFYDYAGGGTMWPTAKRETGLLELIRARLDATGTAVVVTNLRDGKYETDGRAYLGLKRDARDIRLDPRTSEADRLGELKAMRDRGLITEEEYQAKRRQILDRLVQPLARFRLSRAYAPGSRAGRGRLTTRHATPNGSSASRCHTSVDRRLTPSRIRT